VSLTKFSETRIYISPSQKVHAEVTETTEVAEYCIQAVPLFIIIQKVTIINLQNCLHEPKSANK